MKSTIRTATFAFAIAALAALSVFTAPVRNASVSEASTVRPEAHPVPNCPLNDPNGCGIYSNY